VVFKKRVHNSSARALTATAARLDLAIEEREFAGGKKLRAEWGVSIRPRGGYVFFEAPKLVLLPVGVNRDV
jgi:hypothetical protein